MLEAMQGIEPKHIVELGEYVVDYKKPDFVPTRPGVDVIVDADWARDEFTDGRKGKKRYKISAVRFGTPMTMDAIRGWCRENKKTLSPSKPSIELTSDSFLSTLKVAEVTPLILPDHTRTLPRVPNTLSVSNNWSREIEQYLYSSNGSGGVKKYKHGSIYRRHDEPFGGQSSYFLVLEELPLEA